MNEVAIRDDFLHQLKELETMQSVCSKLMQTKHYSQLGEAGIHAIVSKAKSLGIHPFQALNGGFHCINGKVGMSTEMMNALIRKYGHSVTKDPISNDELVVLHGRRADNGDTWMCSFSKEDAIKAGLWSGPTWKKYPGIMLFNRCMSMLFRQLFPDLSLGAGYVKDELDEIAQVGEYSKFPLAQCEVKNVNAPTPQPCIDHIVDTNELVDNTPKTISESDWKELNALLDKCNTDYKDKFWEYLTAEKIFCHTDMKETKYLGLKKSILKHIQESNASSRN